MSARATLRSRIQGLLSPGQVVTARCLARGYELPRWGNLRTVRPLSANFGFERGTPVDRHYLHGFLDRHRGLVRGAVLEVQNSSYTRRFGADVRLAESVDINPDWKPTWLTDLAEASAIPDARYDCVLLPNTVQHLRRLEESLAHVWRVTRPGGAVLASAAGFLPLIPDGPDYWRFTPEGWREMLERHWRGAELEVTGHGNCLAATASMQGLAAEELTPAELDFHDRRYPVLTTILAVKPKESA